MSSQGLGERKLILITTGHKPVFMQNCFDWIAHVSSAARPHLGHMLLFSGMAPPDRLVPAPRATTGTSSARQARSTAWTCISDSGSTTAIGNWRKADSPSHS